MVDNILNVVVDRSAKPQSHLQIVKTRSSVHDPRPRQFHIEDSGLTFLDPH